MKALKGVLVYTGLVILGIILIASLTVGIMFIFPSVKLFGYHFRNVSSQIVAIDNCLVEEIRGVLPQDAKITDIKIKFVGENYNVKFEPTVGSESINATADNNYFGFVKGEKEVDYKDGKLITTVRSTHEVKLDSDGVTPLVTFTMNEPEGWIGYRERNEIVFKVPFQLDSNVINYHLDINTTGGNISLSNSVDGKDKKVFGKSLNVVSMDLKTKKGDGFFQGIGRDVKEDEKEFTVDNLNIKTNGGIFDFTKFDVVNVKNKVVLDSKNATYKFKTLNAQDRGVEINGEVVKFVADKVISGEDGFIYKAESGTLNVGYLQTGLVTTEKKKLEGDTHESVVTTQTIPYENTIFSDSSDIILGTVIGKIGVTNEYGNVKISHLVHQASIRTENGDITIGSSGFIMPVRHADDVASNKNLVVTPYYSETSSLIVYSTFGNITVNKYYQDGVFYSKKGKINVHFYDNGEVKGEIQKDRYFYTDISTKSGKITAVTEGNPININASGSATINLTVKKVKKLYEGCISTNVFPANHLYVAYTDGGTINATLPIQSYQLKVNAKKIAGSVGSVSSFGNDYVQINKSETNQPQMKLSGKKVNLSGLI